MILCYIIRENQTYLTFSCLCCSGNSFIMNINDIYSLLFNPISKATLHKSKQMSENVPCLFWCSTTVKPQGVALKSVNLYVPAVSKQTFPLCCYAAVDCNKYKYKVLELLELLKYLVLQYFHFMLHYSVLFFYSNTFI